MSYADQLRLPNCHREKCGRARHNYKIDENNNNNNNNKYTNQNKTHFKFERIGNNFSTQHSYYDSGCLRINDRSKGVRKGKSKTPAQDRLQKYVGKNKAVIADSLKELVDTKSSVSHLPRNKPSTIATHVPNVKSVIVKCTYVGVAVDSVESKKKLENNGSIVTDVIQKAKSIEMPLSDLSNFPPLNPNKFSIQNQMQSSTTHTTNNHWDTQVQSHLKINDKSRAIGVRKVKLKTPAQERLQKWADKNKTAMFESIKELVDMPTSSLDAKNHRNLIGMQKSHVTGLEPSITHVVGKTATVTNMADIAFIIPDTNVFLHSLACIKMVIEKDLKYIVLIPHAVLQELDNLKRRRGENSFTCKLNATRAIRYIYDLIQAENKRLRGQTAIEDTNRLIDVSSNDDKILNCCLQLIGQSKEVLLVTNDLNLTNIAKLNGVNTISCKACLQRYQQSASNTGYYR